MEATYNKHRFIEEQRRCFEALAELIERIANPADNVITLSGR
jgi:hypothetical protein